VTSVSPAATAPILMRWGIRARFFAAAAGAWAVLYFLADRLILARPRQAPVLLCLSDAGIGAGLLAGAIIVAAAAVAWLIAGGKDGKRSFIALGVALAVWMAPAGVMDDWLVRQYPSSGPPSATPYLKLLLEYAWLAVLLGVVAYFLARQTASKDAVGVRRLGPLFAVDRPAAELRDGAVALLATSAIAAAFILVLTGPRIAATHRGQVIFAVGVAFWFAPTLAMRFSSARDPVWFWPAPLLVGVAGCVLAALRPALPGEYANINHIPAWGLVRPLPIEMASVGLIATLGALRARLALRGTSAA